MHPLGSVLVALELMGPDTREADWRALHARPDAPPLAPRPPRPSLLARVSAAVLGRQRRATTTTPTAMARRAAIASSLVQRTWR